jgi:hypothetical protein
MPPHKEPGRAGGRGRASETFRHHNEGLEDNPASSKSQTHAKPFADREVLATINKNRSEIVRVALTKYEDLDLVDIRIFATFDAADGRPTKKGITLRVEKLPALIEGLQSALAEVRRRCMLPREAER